MKSAVYRQTVAMSEVLGLSRTERLRVLMLLAERDPDAVHAAVVEVAS